MINSISIKNFKSISSNEDGSPIELKFSRLNLIYGKNSSGKSSILRAIVSMCDLMRGKSDFRKPVLKSNRVDLGAYENLVYKHDKCLDAHIGVSINDKTNFSIDFGLLDDGGLANKSISIKTHISFSSDNSSDKNGALDLDNADQSGIYLLNLTTSLNINSRIFNDANTLYYNYSSEEMNNISVVESYKIKNDFGEYIFEKIEHPINTGGLSIENTCTPSQERKLIELKGSDFINSIDRFMRELSHLCYIGPHRQVLKRGFTYEDEKNDIYSYATLQSLNNNQTVLDLVNNALSYIELNYKLTIEPYEDSLRIDYFKFSLYIENLDDKTKTSLSDVGYGISQVIPILIELYSLRSEMMIIEQPELHLHPTQQALLSEIIFLATLGLSPRSNSLKSSRKLEECNELDQKKQVFIETHSEYLLLRLQRLIREGNRLSGMNLDDSICDKINHNELKIYYAEKQSSGDKDTVSTMFKEIRLNKRGVMLDDWPNGFFEERWDEINA
jgi:predicted ATPase